MRIFVTGATGFIGSALVPELVRGGHAVLGLSRSDAGARALEAVGAQVHRGDLGDIDGLRRGAEQSEAVIHLAFNHDFSKFVENAETDRKVITALGQVLRGSQRPMLITSGTGAQVSPPGRAATEDDPGPSSKVMPRGASEEAADAVREQGVRIGVVRLPQVHDTRKQGLVTYAIQMAREKGTAVYVGAGANRWPAAHVSDVARLYRLAIEKCEAGRRYNAVGEEGVTAKALAEAYGRGLGVPVKSVPPEEAKGYLGWLAMFAAHDMPASSALTQQRLGWRPTGPGILADLERMDYRAQ